MRRVRIRRLLKIQQGVNCPPHHHHSSLGNLSPMESGSPFNRRNQCSTITEPTCPGSKERPPRIPRRPLARSVDGEGPTVGRHDRSAVGSTPTNRSHAIHPGSVPPWGETDRPLALWSVVSLVGSFGRVGGGCGALESPPSGLR